MTRVTIGGVLGGIAMWIVGFLFWGTPLNRLAFSVGDDAANAAVQASLAQHLGPTGTGVYAIPWVGTTSGSALFAQGPTAIVLYNSSGFPVIDTGALVGGLILAIVCAVLIGFALLGVSGIARTFGDRLRLVFNHAPWGYYVYLWLSDLVSLVVAGGLIARWFLPNAPAAAGVSSI